jgi:hypothetical protein
VKVERVLLVDHGGIAYDKVSQNGRRQINAWSYDSIPYLLFKEGHFEANQAAKARIFGDGAGAILGVNIFLIEKLQGISKAELEVFRGKTGFEVMSDALNRLWRAEWREATHSTKIEVVGKDFTIYNVSRDGRHPKYRSSMDYRTR